MGSTQSTWGEAKQQQTRQEVIMAGFSWQYFGFTNFDPTWIYRELLFVPILIAVLWFFWMRVVASTQQSGLPCTPGVDINEAYQEAIIQDALSTDPTEIVNRSFRDDQKEDDGIRAKRTNK